MTVTDSPLRRYLQLARREAWLILLVTAVAIAIAAVQVSRQPPRYRASMSLIVAQAGGGLQPVIGSQPLSQTMKNLLESDAVASEVIRRERLATTPKELLKDVHVSFSPDSSVLDVTYESEHAQAAVRVLDRFGLVFKRLVDEQLGAHSGPAALDKASQVPLIVASIFDPAHLKPGTVSPTPA